MLLSCEGMDACLIGIIPEYNLCIQRRLGHLSKWGFSYLGTFI
jgi:hypothetical protein